MRNVLFSAEFDTLKTFTRVLSRYVVNYFLNLGIVSQGQVVFLLYRVEQLVNKCVSFFMQGQLETMVYSSLINNALDSGQLKQKTYRTSTMINTKYRNHVALISLACVCKQHELVSHRKNYTATIYKHVTLPSFYTTLYRNRKRKASLLKIIKTAHSLNDEHYVYTRVYFLNYPPFMLLYMVKKTIPFLPENFPQKDTHGPDNNHRKNP